MMNLIYCFQSEWLKKKRSLASWLIICAAFFTPAIIVVARLFRSTALPKMAQRANFWESLWRNSWESMSVFLLPLTAVMLCALIVQLEYKNNTWKQLHTMPQKFGHFYFAKLGVILFMLLQFFALFNCGVYLAGVLPYFLTGKTLPGQPVPLLFFLQDNAGYLLAVLPVISLQYTISLQFRNFLVPVGAGLMLWLSGLAMLSWSYGYLNPYTYCVAKFLNGSGKGYHSPVSLPWSAACYFFFFMVAGYIFYIRKKVKG